MGASLSTINTVLPPIQDQINAVLPPELLLQIFSLLAPQDIKAAVLVCRHWREVAEAPSLWSWVILRLFLGNQTDMLEFLETRRMKNVRDVRVDMVTGEVLEAVVKHPGLRLKFKIVDLISCEPTLLARARPQMENLHWTELCWWRLSPVQRLRFLAMLEREKHQSQKRSQQKLG